MALARLSSDSKNFQTYIPQMWLGFAVHLAQGTGAEDDVEIALTEQPAILCTSQTSENYVRDLTVGGVLQSRTAID